MTDQTDDQYTPPVDQPYDEPVFDEAPQRVWPTVIGIICIIMGSVGVLCYGCGVLNPVLSSAMMGAIPEDQRPPTPQGMQLVLQVVQSCAAWLMSLWMLIAGIGVCRRRAWSRGHLIAWAVIKILLALLGTLVGIIFLEDQLAQINAQLESQPGGAPFTLTTSLMTIILVLMLVVYLIWPFFLLIWFARGRIREEVELWKLEDRAAI